MGCKQVYLVSCKGGSEVRRNNVPTVNSQPPTEQVGDPVQLPATVISRRAIEYNYDNSLFKRLQLAGYPVKVTDRRGTRGWTSVRDNDIKRPGESLVTRALPHNHDRVAHVSSRGQKHNPCSTPSTHPSQILDTQYRMHPNISKFPSKHFYGGLLLDGEVWGKYGR